MKKAIVVLSVICGFLFGVIAGILLSPKGGGFNTGNITTHNHYYPANSNDI